MRLLSRWKRIATALVLAVAMACAYANLPGFTDLLAEADEVRSVDPQRFEVLIGELNARLDEATPAQREHLRYLKAYQLAYTGRYDLAIQEATQIFEASTDVSLRFRAGLLIANSHAATREFAAGLGAMDQALALMPQVSDLQLRNDGMTVAALLYNQVGQHETGLRFANDILAGQPSDRTRCYVGYLKMEAEHALERFPDSLVPVEDLIRLCVAQDERVAANMARGHLARMLDARDQSDAALALLQEHLPEVETTAYPHLISEIHSLLAQMLLARDDLAGAERHALRAVQASQGSRSSLPVVNAHKTLYDAAIRRGDTAAALAHHIDYAESDRAYLDDVQAKALAFQLVKHETLQKNQTIELLNKQNQVLTLEQQVASKSAQATRLLVALLALLLASIAYWAFKVKKMQLSFRRLAETDTLTGVSNRHHFTARAEAALEQCRKAGEDAALVMLDLDHFKAINDQYGHAAGDWALREVGAICRQMCGERDLVGRLGGEEFAFLVVGRDLAAGLALARECRRRIAALDTAGAGQAFPVTASFGVAGTRICGYPLDALLAKADGALYRAKREGRDRVSVHTGAVEDALSTPLA